MFLLSVLLYFASQATIHANPITSSSLPVAIDTRDFPSGTDDAACSCPQLRSIWDIVWSCLATIFACTWISIHPNSPGPKIAKSRTFLTRLELMIWTLLIPELISFWAFRQWLGARALARRYKGFGWSTAHGHFLQMGGFVLVEGDEDKEVLPPERFHELLIKGEIRFPRVSEDEINSLSKGDGFSKMIVVCQTSWFIAQCISRAVHGLFITQLELMTVAFAFLNILMYFLWWNKPLDLSAVVRIVICKQKIPIPLSRLHADGVDSVGNFNQHDYYNVEFPADEIGLDPIHQDINCNEIQVLEPHHSVDCDKHGPGTGSTNVISDEAPTQLDVGISSNTKNNSSNVAVTDSPLTHSGESETNLRYSSIYAPWYLLYDIIKHILERTHQMCASTYWNDHGASMFYSSTEFTSGNSNKDSGCSLPIACIGALFGVIHCAGWNFVFPSRADMLIWRISSALISAYPSIADLITVIVWVRFNFLNRHKSSIRAHQHVASNVLTITLMFLPIYLLARLMLIIEAFITLRDLPKGAFMQVEWTQALPHI